MITLVPTEKTLELAKQYATKIGSLNKSITNGEINNQGALGELAVRTYLGLENKLESTYDYDFIYNGKKVEVKTMGTNFIPNNTYLCAINKNSSFQQCDIYVFCFLNNKTKKVYIAGWIEKDLFYNKCYYQEKNKPFLSLTSGLKEDQYLVSINELNKMELLK